MQKLQNVCDTKKTAGDTNNDKVSRIVIGALLPLLLIVILVPPSRFMLPEFSFSNTDDISNDISPLITVISP